jgi:hypothetical protein
LLLWFVQAPFSLLEEFIQPINTLMDELFENGVKYEKNRNIKI